MTDHSTSYWSFINKYYTELNNQYDSKIQIIKNISIAKGL